MHLSFQTLVLAALSLEGALSQPAHRHQHKHRRDLADVLNQRDNIKVPDEVLQSLPWNKICANGACDGTKAAAPEAPVAANKLAVNPVKPAVVASSGSPSGSASSAMVQSSSPPSSSTPPSSGSSSGSSTGSCSSLASVWDMSSRDNSRDNMPYMGNGSACPGGCTSAHGAPFSSFPKPPTTPANLGETDGYRGNVGEPYGHNMYPLSDCDVSGQKYAITFINADTQPIEVAIWLKVGDDYESPDRKQTGQTRNAFWKFPLAPGQSGAFAVQENTQMAFSQACQRSSTLGNFDCAWGEADFGNANNKGWSGFDRSTILNSAGNTGLLTICAEGHGCSSKEAHSFISASQTDAGGDLSIPAEENAHFRVTMG